MYLIARTHEIAPQVWSSTPVVVGRTVSHKIAQSTCAERNKAAARSGRRLRTRYSVVTAN